jgi:four helix bundle protein
MQDFRNLAVWRKAHALTLAVYVETRQFPLTERYGLTSQLRRSVASVSSNVAEGCGCFSDRDFARFIQHALSSACVVDYQLLLAHDLSFLDAPTYRRLASACIEVKRMLTGLLQTLRAES